MTMGDNNYYTKDTNTRFTGTRIEYNSADKREAEDTVQCYRKARAEGKDGVAFTSQNFWYANKVSRKVMEKYGVSLKESYHVMSKKDQSYLINIGDGVFKRMQYHSPVCKKKTYYMGTKPCLTIHEGLQEKCILADTKRVTSKLKFCENCGALNDMTKAYNGCKFCGAPIRVREVHKKIVSIENELSGEWYRRWLMIGTFVVTFLMMVISNICEMKRDGYFEYGITTGTICYLLLTTVICTCFAALIGGIILGNIIYIPMIIKLNASESRISAVGRKMQKKDPGFSYTEFYGMAQSYLRLWLVSQNRDEMGYVFMVDPCNNNQIIDADCLACKKSEVWEEQGFTYIRLKLLMRYVEMKENRLEVRRKKMMITLRRKVGVRTKLQTETLVCDNCGAPIDILRGGKCEFCGTVVEIDNHEWVVVEGV